MSLSLFAGPFSGLYDDADVLGWRKKLARKLGLACDWDESEDAPQRSVESGSFPAWDALRLAVAYHQHPHLKRPKKLPEWVSDDPAWLSLVKPGFPLRFNQIQGPGNWLPLDFEGWVELKDPSGDEKQRYGSVINLVRQLEQLNAELFHATKKTLAKWRTYHDEALFANDPIEYYARFGLTVYLDLARWAAANEVPLMLSY